MLGSDMRRRVGEVERRIDWLDQHGTRGVETMRAQLVAQAEDLGEIKRTIVDVQALLDDRQASRSRAFVAYALALLPVYVLLFLSFTAARGR